MVPADLIDIVLWIRETNFEVIETANLEHSSSTIILFQTLILGI